MLTLTQWKQARRVDHFKLLAWNVRYRGTPDQQLKAFDQLVADYHAAQTVQARMVTLGEIVARATAYAQGAHAANTQNPVAALAAAAEADLRLLLAGHDVNADTALNELKSDPARWGLRQVTVNSWIVVPDGQEGGNYSNVETMINAHLTSANSLYATAGMNLTVVRSNRASPVASRVNAGQPASRTNTLLELAPDPKNLTDQQRANLTALNARAGRFSMDSRARTATWLNGQPMNPKSIDLVYVPALTEDDAQGLTTGPTLPESPWSRRGRT